MPKKSKKQKWFIAGRGSYLPNSWQGWLSYIPYSAFLVFAALIDWTHYNSHAQAGLVITADWVAAAVVMTWLAKRTS